MNNIRPVSKANRGPQHLNLFLTRCEACQPVEFKHIGMEANVLVVL